ncbi:MAG: siderophore-interacting protein [Paracoccus denitrificans]|uniref:Siderophore-interacting protein n=1 Tax=Paracoccus denitrificans TaxID=266 RepID=A0A533I6A2_PARDE|nr:MAG: siderophore-interacting protein [Paracoccus denitrificans]
MTTLAVRVMPAHESQRYAAFLRQLEVLEVRDLSARMRRLTLAGPQLRAHVGPNGPVPGFASRGPDDHVKLFFPDPVTGVVTLPAQEGTRLRWPDDPAAISRDYTPRGYAEGSDRLDVDFVLHGHGTADAWAAQAQPGDRITIAGPRTSMMIPQAKAYLLLGDETAIPAIGNWLAMLPARARITAHILTIDRDTMPQIALRAGADVHWHRCDMADPQAMVAVMNDGAIEPETYVWAGGEFSAIAALRRHLDRLDFDPGMTDLASYWIRGKTQPL